MAQPSDPVPSALPLWPLLALALMSASLLGFEVLLTRAIAIQHWHHLAAVVIAVALLGLGCAGSLSAVLSSHFLRWQSWWLPAMALATALSIPLSLLWAQWIPLNMLALPWHRQQALYLVLYALCFLLPFFCGAMYITLTFMRWSQWVGTFYAADLAGSALGALLAWGWLEFGVPLEITDSVSQRLETAFCMMAALPLLALLLHATPALSIRLAWAMVGGVLLMGGVLLVEGFRWQMPITPSAFKGLPEQLQTRGAQILAQQDSARSRLALVSSPGQHVAPGLSIVSDLEAPRQWHVFSDSDDAMPLLLDAAQMKYQALFEQVLLHAAFLLAPAQPRVLLLPGSHSWNGWGAYWHQASAITVLEPDRLLAQLLAHSGTWPKQLQLPGFLPPSADIINTQPRRYLQEPGSSYDLILADLGSHPVGSPANRPQLLLTQEALQALLQRVSTHGVLAISGQVMPPPRDSLRLLNSILQVLQKQHLSPRQHVVVIRDWQNILLLVSRQPFSESMLRALARWCEHWHFDIEAMPGLQVVNANRFHQKPEALYLNATQHLLSVDAPAFIDEYPFQLTITSDDQPYFYHFFRWRHWQQIKQQLGPSWLLAASWGYLLNLLALAGLAMTALILIFSPLWATGLRTQVQWQRWRMMGYFGAIGFGFMFIEIALMQKSLLLLDSELSAFVTVLVALLLGSGIGSLWAGRAVDPGQRARVAALVVALGALVFPWLFDFLFALSLSWSAMVRTLVLALLLVVLAIPMGMMLPAGIARIRTQGSGSVAWAWGINGYFSVLGALAAPLIALEIGLSGLLMCATGLYLVAGWVPLLVAQHKPHKNAVVTQ